MRTRTLDRKRTSRGFTLVELMVVIMIVGVLSSIAIYLTIRLQERAFTNAVLSDLSSAYKASVAFHTDDPDGEVTEVLLEEHGYRQTEQVTLNVVDGFEETLLIQADHPNVSVTYQVDNTGTISHP